MSLWTRLRAALSAEKPRIATSAVVSHQSVWQQFSRIGGSVTPADVSSIILQADGGDPSRLVDLANDVRQKSGHLQAALGTRENALTSLPLVIAPHIERGERDPADRDAEVAAFVEDALKAAVGDGQETRGVDDLIPHLNGAIYHGFSNAETAWKRDGRFLVPSGFALLDQRRFGFRQRDGRLVLSAARNNAGFGGSIDGIDLMADHPGQFLQHMPRVNGDVPVREGLSHLLVWLATFRNYDLSDWLALSELAWKPWRIGRYGIHAGDADKANLLKALEHATSNGILMLREDHQLDLKWPGTEGGAKSTHKELADWLGAEMSKAILGQTLTVEAGERGARSLGEVHDRVRKDIRDQDAKAVAATLRRDLVRPIVWLNFGDVPIPGVAFATDDAVDVTEFAKGMTELKTAGLKIPTWYVYDVSGVPIPQDDEEVLGETDAEDVDVAEFDEDEDEDDGAQDEQEPDEESTEAD